MGAMSDAPLSPEAFVGRLRDEGAHRYHDEHPFHRAMHAGRLSREQLQSWVANRYYYQTRIPIKDALIVAKSEDPRFRRMWLHRIVDHDGAADGEGGLALWHRIGRAVGLDDGELVGLGRVLVGVRFACDAYVHFVRDATLVEAVASSLTELFAPDIMQRRIAAWQEHYPWIGDEALAYFRSRVPRASRDAGEAVAFVVREAGSRELQDRCVAALIKKTEILWHLLDCVEAATR
jgi:pyrroloquinoline-quinone synthase